MLRYRRQLLITLMLAALGLLVASSAFACTVWKGKFSVTGDSGGTVEAIGAGQTMVDCAAATGTAEATNGGWVTITMEPGTCDGSTYTLSAGDDYEINYINDEAYLPAGFPTHRNWLLDCMSPADGVDVHRLQPRDNGTADVEIDINGYSLDDTGSPGSRDFDLPTLGNYQANSMTDESAICISDPSAGEGMQAPINMI